MCSGVLPARVETLLGVGIGTEVISPGELEVGVTVLGLHLTAQGRMSVLLLVLVFRGGAL